MHQSCELQLLDWRVHPGARGWRVWRVAQATAARKTAAAQTEWRRLKVALQNACAGTHAGTAGGQCGSGGFRQVGFVLKG